MKKNSMKRKSSLALLGMILTVSFLSACANKKVSAEAEKEAPPPASPEKKWDYEKIRQVRADEKLTTPIDGPTAPEATLTDDCEVVSPARMKQAKLSGCKKLDPRLGYGENSYCCPKIQ